MAQEVYDDEKRIPDDFQHKIGESGAEKRSTASDLSHREGEGGFYHPLHGEHEDKPQGYKSLGSSELGAAESLKGRAQLPVDQVGKGFVANGGDEASLAQRTFGRLVGTFSNHKKGFILGGGAGIGIVVLVIFIFAGIASYALVTMEKTLIGEEAKVEQHFERKAAQEIMQKIVCRTLPTGCKNNNGDPDENNKPTADEEASAKANGETLAEDMGSFDITSPQVEQDLTKAGVTVETDPATGELTGLKDAAGQDITGDIANNINGAADAINTALPEYEVGQLEVYRPTMVDQAGSSFDSGISKSTPDDQVDSIVEDQVTKGATNAELAEAASETEGEQPSQKEGAAKAEEYTSEKTATGQLGEALDATGNALNAGESSSSAIQKGVESLKGAFTDPIFLAGFATTLCSINDSVKDAAKARVPEIMTLLIRHGTTLISLADQLKTGNITGGQVNQIMQMFNGDPSAPKNSDGSASEASLPFSASAAWQKASGGGGGIPIDDSSLPIANAGSRIVDQINDILHGAGVSYACSALTSPFGFAIQTFAGIVQVAADTESFGGAQIGISLGILTANTTLSDVLLPQIIKYFTPVGLDGKEDSVQWLNNADAGLNLSFNDYARRLGGVPQSTSSANNLYAEATTEQLRADQQLPWTDRAFALSNPYSLTSRLLNDLPLGEIATINGTISGFMHLPSVLAHNLASIFLNKSFAQAQPTNPGELYDTATYAFTDSEVNKYDPIANEQYLFSTVSAGGKSVRRIDALGNPNTYTSGDDSNNNDLLHCFVDSYATIEEANPDPNPNTPLAQDPGADQNCGGIGMYDNSGAVTPIPSSYLPNDSTVVSIYCNALGNPSGCAQQMKPQVNDDVGHFRQYLLDLSVMNNYTSLTNNQ